MGFILVELKEDIHELAKRIAGSEGMYLKDWLPKQITTIVNIKKKNLKPLSPEESETTEGEDGSEHEDSTIER